MQVLRCLLVGLACLLLPVPASAGSATTREIVDAYAQWAIRSGRTVGLGVAVITGNQPPAFFTYGSAMVGTGGNPSVPFTADSLFEIGSVTKVFTTNLLGQDVYLGKRSLDDPLSSFSTQLGTFQYPLMSTVTLKELADFTAGIPDYAPLCRERHVPGCLQSERPPINRYTAQRFADFFRHERPRNWNENPPPPVSSLPAPYFYSDYSIGLLGLLLAAKEQPLDNSAVGLWLRDVRRRILRPLGMRNTYLAIPPDKRNLKAGGYQQALAAAEVVNGAISSIDLIDSGNAYSAAPAVRIVGGGGRGARARAFLDSGGPRVGRIKVVNGGSGYIAPAKVHFSDGGSSTEASASAIVSNGKVVAIVVEGGGEKYQRVPTVTIEGGRRPGGRDARAVARIANGHVTHVAVTDGGAGYVDPLAVVVAPGAPTSSVIPVWAPAGALSTTLTDMAKFVSASLPLTNSLPPARRAIRRGFQIAQRAYACTGPRPQRCSPSTNRSGLAWAIQPADPAAGVPKVVSKNGGLPGFATQVMIMPDRALGVIVFANSRPPTPQDEKTVAIAGRVAQNILYALFYRCAFNQRCDAN